MRRNILLSFFMQHKRGHTELIALFTADLNSLTSLWKWHVIWYSVSHQRPIFTPLTSHQQANISFRCFSSGSMIFARGITEFFPDAVQSKNT